MRYINEEKMIRANKTILQVLNWNRFCKTHKKLEKALIQQVKQFIILIENDHCDNNCIHSKCKGCKYYDFKKECWETLEKKGL